MLDKIETAANLIVNAGKVLICGNGGSAAESLHFAAELLGRYKLERRPIAAMALLDPATITAIGNDYGFDQIFSRQVIGLANPNSSDVLVAISTSGRSLNVIQAAQAARSLGVAIIALTGNGGADLATYADVLIDYRGSTAHIQEMHLVAIHHLCALVDNLITGKLAAGHQADSLSKTLENIGDITCQHEHAVRR